MGRVRPAGYFSPPLLRLHRVATLPFNLRAQPLTAEGVTFGVLLSYKHNNIPEFR